MIREEAEAYTEVLTVLNNMEAKYKAKIPKKLIELFENNCATDYNFSLDVAIPLKDQNLKRKTLALLALLDLNYWCESKEEKEELLNKYRENDIKKQEELREKYNPDNIFKRNREEEQIEENTEVKAMVEYKEPLLKRIINKIKRFFGMY